ncbi:MAG: permease prefix domain 1-containing protein [Chloroflexota bacterium]
MADRSLLDAYLARLDASLPLTDAERVDALEEIEGHIADVTAELIERGLPADVAERRALSRLGAPERLAHDLAAAHRTPRDLLVATGVALRSTVRAVVWSVLVTWVLVFVIGLALALAWALVSRLVTLPHIETGWVNAPLVAGTMALAAFAVGRSIVRPVALAAHRPERGVRVAVLLVGLPIAALAGLAWIDLSWNFVGAALAALLPAWFTAGVLRPDLMPAWFPLDRPRIGWALIAVIVISLAGLTVSGGMPTQTVTGIGREIDPATEFIAIAPFKHFDLAPLEEINADGAFDDGYNRGTGPIEWSLTWRRTSGDALAGWTDLRAEVWVTGGDAIDGPLAAGEAVGPVASAPISVVGSRATTSLSVRAVPTREFYYLAVVGTDPDGERQLAAWPHFRQWTWSGTPLEFILASLR